MSYAFNLATKILQYGRLDLASGGPVDAKLVLESQIKEPIVVIYLHTDQGDFCATCGHDANWEEGGLWCYECSRYLVER